MFSSQIGQKLNLDQSEGSVRAGTDQGVSFFDTDVPDVRRKRPSRAVRVAGLLCRANADAQLGVFRQPHPSLCAPNVGLFETHRGWC